MHYKFVKNVYTHIYTHMDCVSSRPLAISAPGQLGPFLGRFGPLLLDALIPINFHYDCKIGVLSSGRGVKVT